MAWPKYGDGQKTGRERIVDAFWEAIEREPYARADVRSLCAAARVNKNTFYYHWRNIDELAADAVSGLLDPGLFDAVLRMLRGDGAGAALPEVDEKSLARVCLVAGANGSPEMRGMLRDAITQVWATGLGVEIGSLPLPARLDFEFAVGGVMSVLAHSSELGPESVLAEVAHASFPQHIARLVGAIRG